MAHSGAGVLLPAIARAVSAATAVWLAAYVPDLPGGTSMLDDIKAQRDAMFHPDWLGADPTSDPELALWFLFHDCDLRIRQWALGTLRLFNPGPAVYQHSPAALPAGISLAAVVPAADRTLRSEWNAPGRTPAPGHRADSDRYGPLPARLPAPEARAHPH